MFFQNVYLDVTGKISLVYQTVPLLLCQFSTLKLMLYLTDLDYLV